MASTNSPSSRFAVEAASPQDATALLEILESRPLPGPVALVYTRRPDAYRSLQREGEHVGVVVCRDRERRRVLAMGAYAIRTLYVDGKPERVAYLFGLRGLGDALKSLPVLHRGYALIRDQLASLGVTRAITTIVESNHRVAAMLGQSRRIMPAYRDLGRYDVFALLPGGRRAKPGVTVRTAAPGDAGRIAEFLDHAGRHQQFFPRVRPEDLLAARGVPPLAAIHWLEGRAGEVLATAALWDQTDYRQYRVHRYGGALAWMRRTARWAPFLGIPRLPDPGAQVACATLALWAARDDAPALLERLLDGLGHAASAYPFLLAGVHAEHPLHGVFRRRRHVAYRSRVYRVDWEPAAPALGARPLYLECGTL